MRFITGILFGIVLTVGTAYIVDAAQSAPGPDEQGGRQMVNWTVVDTNVRNLSTDIQDGWARLVGGVKQIDRKTGI